MKKTLLPLLACLVVLSGCSIPKIGSTPEVETIVTKDSAETVPATTDAPAAETPEAPTTDESGIETAATDTPTAVAEGGVYLPYTSTAVAQAKGTIVLFFHASWSPVCVTINKNIEENTKKIPSDLTILKVNFDDAVDLRQAYSVDEQATFVQVDNTGKLIKKWRGESTVADIVNQTKN